MKDRILKFLQIENINPSKFADEIGVQRSSISHILSGRNNPSLDLIQKILLRFDYINAEWLITGKGEMFKPNREPTLFDELYSKKENLNQNEQNATFKKDELYNKSTETKKQTSKNSDLQKISDNAQQNTDNVINRKKVVKIILLYEDGKAEIYYP
ncbi:MAG: helix-turn-helix transcriptional regulator [Bacteroidales bacterium]